MGSAQDHPLWFVVPPSSHKSSFLDAVAYVDQMECKCLIKSLFPRIKPIFSTSPPHATEAVGVPPPDSLLHAG